MNPIIGTLVNGENNITTNQSFCLVLGLYLAAWKDKQNLYTYLLIGLVHSVKEGEKFSTKKTPQFPDFFRFSKNPPE
jgi:hypothetical protein